MTVLTNRIAHLDWTRIATALDSEGHALLPGILCAAQVQALRSQISNPLSGPINDPLLRPVSLTEAGLGRGRMFFFDNRLPDILAVLRAQLYRHLAPIANHWNQLLGLAYRYPGTLERFLQANRHAAQRRQLSHLHLLREADYIALHQHKDGELAFPLQAVMLLSEPGRDFSGGELVMTEQRPRMQSRPLVLSLRQGDIAILSSGHRPVKGSKGFYRVNMKHAISRIRGGQRIGLALIFHHAPADDERDPHEQGTLLDLDRP